ncbi:MAG: leucine-rich repeat domain-containing protein [Bacteroidaceae bacterium]|nr:leucine-rich repeat domain-containing protein [Bacteroidaceae bacterium]
MKRLKTILLALVASVCSLTAWAERTAPVIHMKPSATFELDKEYYLYNVGSGLFLNKSDNNPTAMMYGEKVTIHQVSAGLQIIYARDSRLFFAESTTTRTETSGNSWYDCFSITAVDSVENGYVIQKVQKNATYNANEYIGYDGANDKRIKPNMTDGNIVWQFVDAELVEKEMSRGLLYLTMEQNSIYDFAFDEFDAICNNENSTTEELNAAIEQINNGVTLSNAISKHSLHDSPIFFVGDGWREFSGTIRKNAGAGNTMELKGFVNVSKTSTILYNLFNVDSSAKYSSQTYIDGVLVRTLDKNQLLDTYNGGYRDFLSVGKHEIVWKFTATASYDLQFGTVGVISTPEISVNLLEPGSLGSEILYNVDNIKDVRNLKIKGKMNSEDWEKIKMMQDLFILDLGEAEITDIPDNFTWEYYKEGNYTYERRASFADDLYRIILPPTLTYIGESAFRKSLADIEIPVSVATIGRYAFSASRAKKANLANVKNVPGNAFNNCYLLEELTLSEQINTIGGFAFDACYSLKPQKITFPNTLTSIYNSAFRDCSTLNFRFPDKYLEISREAFQNTGIDSLILHQTYSSINDSWSPFRDLQKLTYAEFPTEVNSLNFYTLLRDCPNLSKVVLKSPTKVNISEANLGIGSLTISVPSHLVNTYKLDNYWYNAKAIEPFDYSSIENIILRDNLTLSHERFGGQPSIWMEYNTYLKVNGDKEQKFQDISVACDYPNNRYSQILSNCPQLVGYGDNIVRYHSAAKKWYFISLPFDLKISNIYNNYDAQYAIRYYDGAGRATNGNSGNWKNYTSSDVIPAGTGFILQTNIDVWSYFPGVDNENKYVNTIGVTEFSKTLDINPSVTAGNKGWNLVGNPYQCYYNNHCLNFTGPITVWNPNNKTYTAYSLTDDDYAIRPNEAFFVQCPNEEYNTISFPLQGRQLTAEIESQNAVKAWAPEATNRQIINLSVSNDEMTDHTRVVLNDKASLTYETTCDASKFMSMDNMVPQIYTLDDMGTMYAINERPIAEGSVNLGFYAGQTGDYTISVTRCDAEHVFITDNVTGKTTEITNDAYSFSAKAGTDNKRFALSFVSNDATAIETIEHSPLNIEHSVYDLSGRKVNAQSKNGIYIVRQGKKVNKVVVH